MAQTEAAPSILIVDDNPLITNVLVSLFNSQQYDVHCAPNGAEALKVLSENPSDVILCDVMMPELDGYGFFEKVRSNSEYAHIPFIFLTALSDKKDVTDGVGSGADDYITKPFDPQHLLALVKGKIIRAQGIKEQSTTQNEQFRKRIIHTLSHEFRTPLVAINTGTELLLEQNIADAGKAQSLLQAIQRGGARLERLVNDFMLMQQVEAGIAQRLFDNRAVAVPPGEAIEPLVESKREEVEQKGFTLTYSDFASNVKCRMYQPQVQEVLWRIIDNAMKFSEEAKEIDVRILMLDNEVGVEVLDRGIGFNIQQATVATDTFTQLDREKLEQQGGGLGLALVKRYVKIHDGEFTLESRKGGGTCARFTLPIAPSTELSS